MTPAARELLVKYFGRCELCKHRPRSVRYDHADGSVVYRHVGPRVLAHEELCAGCVESLILVAEGVPGDGEVTLRLDWTALATALID